MFVDTHCHLTNDNYENLDILIKKLGKNMVIVNGVDLDTSINAINVANTNKNVYAAIGIHPESADTYKDSDLAFIRKNLDNPNVVAIGEIGLDYYWRKDNIEKQQLLFKKQIEMALTYNKPIIVHSRDAIEDTYSILYEYYTKNQSLRAVLHCYSSSKEMARKFLKMDVMFGIGGVLTFKNERKLKEVVKSLEMNRILLETDSPYLTPEPFRGQKNTPLNIPLIANKIAEIKGITTEEVLDITTKNARSKFDLKI